MRNLRLSLSRISVQLSPCCSGVTSTKKRKISARRFHDGEPIVSRIPSWMCVGRGGFQDQDIACPCSPSSFYSSLVLPLAFYCWVAVLAWITSVIHIFIAEISTDVWEIFQPKFLGTELVSHKLVRNWCKKHGNILVTIFKSEELVYPRYRICVNSASRKYDSPFSSFTLNDRSQIVFVF